MGLDSTARLVLQFELVDKATQQATANLRKIQGEAKQTNSEIKKSMDGTSESMKNMEKATNQTGQSFERAFGQASRQLVFFGGAVTGALAVAVNHASKTNFALYQSTNQIKDAVNGFLQSVGVSMIPIMQKLASWINRTAESWKNLNPAVRDSVVQWTAIVGASALVIGTLGTLVDRLSKIGKFLKDVSDLLKLKEVAAFFGLSGGGGLLAAGAIGGSAAFLSNRIQSDLDPSLGSKKLVGNFVRLMQDAAGAWFNPGSIGLKLGISASNKLFGQNAPVRNPAPGAIAESLTPHADLGSISVRSGGGKVSKQTKELDDLKSKGVSVADEIGNRFKIMAEEYMRSLGGIAGVTMTMLTTSIDGVSKSMGDAVAQSLVYGKDFAETMKAALASLAASVISFLVGTIAKIAILRALGVVGPIFTGAVGLTGGGSGGSGGESGGKSGGIGGFFKNMLGFAEGGTIREPIVGVGLRSGGSYSFGERGPETITPMTSKSGASSGGTVTINISGNNVRSQQDINDIAYQVSKVFKRETMRLA